MRKHRFKSLIAFLLCNCLAASSSAQTCAPANAGADKKICDGTGVTIGTASQSGYTYSWSPSTGLSSTTVAQPTANPSSTTTYTLSMTPVNLIPNPAFESGNTGFNSDYPSLPSTPECTSIGYITVDSDPHNIHSQWCNKADHSASGTLMLIVDGTCNANRRVWYQTVSVVPGRQYTFSGWASTINDQAGSGGAAAVLRVRVVDNTSASTDIVANYTVPSSGSDCSTWGQFSGTWNSGTATSATIEIVDLTANNNSGNDFCIDDLSFISCTPDDDQVTVTVGSNPVVTGYYVTNGSTFYIAQSDEEYLNYFCYQGNPTPAYVNVTITNATSGVWTKMWSSPSIFQWNQVNTYDLGMTFKNPTSTAMFKLVASNATCSIEQWYGFRSEDCGGWRYAITNTNNFVNVSLLPEAIGSVNNGFKEVYIYDLAGNIQKKNVYPARTNHAEIDISSLKTGAYMVKVFDGKGWTQKKIAIIR